MKFVFSPDVILCGWLGSKHQLTKYCWSSLLLNSLSFCYYGTTVPQSHLHCNLTWYECKKVSVIQVCVHQDCVNFRMSFFFLTLFGHRSSINFDKDQKFSKSSVVKNYCGNCVYDCSYNTVEPLLHCMYVFIYVSVFMYTLKPLPYCVHLTLHIHACVYYAVNALYTGMNVNVQM